MYKVLSTLEGLRNRTCTMATNLFYQQFYISILLVQCSISNHGTTMQTYSTSLLWAAQEGHVAVARVLLENRAETEVQDYVRMK